MADIFISYSRRDKAFVQRLNDELRERGKETWVDWEGILPSAEWLKEIYAAIESADAVVFVISPDSASSEVCGQEIEHAVANNKRVIPIVYRDVSPNAVPKIVAAHNWIFIRETDDFKKASDSLITALDTDIEWVHAHTRLLTRAKEWKGNRQDGSMALSGNDLKRAEQILTQNASDKEPHLTPLQIEYILGSRKLANHRQRLLIGAISTVFFAATILSLMIWQNHKRAVVYQSRDFLAKAVWALADNDVLTAEILLAKSLTLDDQSDARERFLEAQVRSVPVLWVSPTEAGRKVYAVSPKGRYALVQDQDNSVHIWDVEKRTILYELKGIKEPITCSVFGHDERYLALGFNDSNLQVWDMSDGKKTQTIHCHQGDLIAVAFSPEGRYLATAGQNLTIRLWNPASGAPIRTLKGPDEQLTSVAFSPDSRNLAAGSWDHHIWVWDVETGKFLRRMTGHEDSVLSEDYSPDGKYIVSGSWDTNVWLWDAKTGQKLRPFYGNKSGVLSFAFSEDMRRLVTGSEYGSLRVWDVETGKNILTLVGHQQNIGSVAFTADQKRIVSVSLDGTIRVWDIARLDNKDDCKTYRGFTSIASIVTYSPKENYFAAGSEDSTARVWNAKTGALVHVFRGHTKGLWGVTFSGDERLFLTCSRDDTIRIWDMKTGKMLRLIRLKASVRRLYFNPVRNEFASGSDDGMVRIWDPVTGKVRFQFTINDTIICMCYSPDGEKIVVSGQDGKFQIWNLKTHEKIDILKNGDSAIWGLSFGADSNLLATGDEDGYAKLWDTASRSVLHTWREHKGAVWDLSFSPRGDTIATAGQDSTVRLYNTKIYKSLALRGYESAVWSVYFSPSGHYLASASQDRTVRLWNIDEIRKIMTEPPANLYAQAERDTGLRIVNDQVISGNGASEANVTP